MEKQSTVVKSKPAPNAGQAENSAERVKRETISSGEGVKEEKATHEKGVKLQLPTADQSSQSSGVESGGGSGSEEGGGGRQLRKSARLRSRVWQQPQPATVQRDPGKEKATQGQVSSCTHICVYSS